MLDPRSRQMLLASLRPPNGFRFDCAVATTFSLDLVALLAAPLAFTLFDRNDDTGRLMAEPQDEDEAPIVLLESLRRCTDRIHIYCQAGRIAVPPNNQRLLTYLESSILEVVSPSARQGKPGVFHPKIWVLRFVQKEDQDRVAYRLLCLSRNLTFDRSWDTALVLDGVLADRQRGIALNRPLADFIRTLPELLLRPMAMTKQARADTARIADELRVVKWELPENVEAIRFWALGTAKEPVWPFQQSMERLLVLAPFVTPDFLNRIAAGPSARFLVSRTEALQSLDPALLRGTWSCFALEDRCNAIAVTEDGAEPQDHSMSGLHAKLFVADDGKNAHIWTGSANATTAAFQYNVEFLVQLTGEKSKLGVSSLLEEGGNDANLRSLLVPFEPHDEATKTDATETEFDAKVDRIRGQLSTLDMELAIAVAGTDGKDYTSTLQAAMPIDPIDGVVIRCRPVMLAPSDGRKLSTGVPIHEVFGPHAAATISSFVAFEIIDCTDDVKRQASFVLNLPLTGAPTDRRALVLRELLRDEATLVRFLLLMLADEPEQLLNELGARGPMGFSDAATWRPEGLPLLEHMLRALHRCPERLDQVQQVVEDLRRSEVGRAFELTELESVWEPIRSARAAQRARATGGSK